MHLYYRRNKKRRASVLIICMSILMVLAIMGISMIRVSTIDKLASSNYAESSSAQMIARSGIEYAVAMLRIRYDTNTDDPLDSSDTHADNLYDSMASFPLTADEAGRSHNWAYWVRDNTTGHDRTDANSSAPEDWTGAGVRIEDMINSAPADTNPSFYNGIGAASIRPSEIINGRKVSFLSSFDHYASEGRPYAEGDRKSAYTLKIFDTTSMLNLNMQIDPANPTNQYPTGTDLTDNLANPAAGDNPADPVRLNDPNICTIINNFSLAVLQMPWYTNRGGDTAVFGPLQDLGPEIIARRIQLGGFTSKWDLVGVARAGTTKVITREDVIAVWDLITVFPGVNDFTRTFGTSDAPMNPYRYVRRDAVGDPVVDYRSPINVNSASWPVLVALFQGIFDGTDTILSIDARALATAICEYRGNNGTFESWKDWDDFLRALNNASDDPTLIGSPDMPYGVDPLSDAKLALVRAMSTSAQVPAVTNPDRLFTTGKEKTDLLFYTTEICLIPYGTFEITSMGEILDHNDRVLGAAKANSIVRVYEMVRIASQLEFDYTQFSRQDFDQQQEESAFAFGNNIQRPYADENELPTDPANANSPAGSNPDPSDLFGYVQPIVSYHSTYDFSTSPEIVLGDGPNITKFKRLAHLAGGLNVMGVYVLPFITNDTTTMRCDFDGTVAPSLGNTATPRSLTPKSAADIIPDTAAAPGDLAPDGVVFTGGDGATLCYEPPGSNYDREGVMGFWFKLKERPTEWTPVFFMTQPLGNIVLLDYGVQTYIAIQAPDANTTNIRVGRQIYIRGLGIFPNDGPGRLLFSAALALVWGAIPKVNGESYVTELEMSFDRSADMGIETGEWYHLLCRWTDYVGLDRESIAGVATTAPQYNGLVVSGNFYDSSGDVANSGPQFEPLSESPPATFSTTTHISTTNINTWKANWQPWYEEEITGSPALPTNGRMYFGNVPNSPTGALDVPSIPGLNTNMAAAGPNDNTPMTIDDIRIENEIAFAADNPSHCLPSRYNRIAGTLHDRVAVFQGQIPAVSGATPGSAFLSVRNWSGSFNSPSGQTAEVTAALEPPTVQGNGDYSLSFSYPNVDEPIYRTPVIDELLVTYHLRHVDILRYQWINDF